MILASLFTRYVASRHLRSLSLKPSQHYVTHALLGNRRVYQQDALDYLSLFQDLARTPIEAAEEGIQRGLFVDPGDAERVNWHQTLLGFVQELLRAHLLLPEGTDEETLLRQHISARWGADPIHSTALGAIEDAYAPVLAAGLHTPRNLGVHPVRVLLLGWCFTQSVAPIFKDIAAREGFDAQVTVGFFQDLHLLSSKKSDFAVLQLSHRLLLAPLMDAFAETTSEERAYRTAQAIALVEAAIRNAREAMKDGLLLVQGIALPQTSPLGMAEYRVEHGLFECLRRINAAAIQAIAKRDDMAFIDEDRLLSNHGKRVLLDDLVSTYSHHGVLGMDPVHPESQEQALSFGIQDRSQLYRLLAEEYLATWFAWTGRDAIRVIAVDLDNTLWPGQVGDEGFTFDSDDMTVALMYGRHAGLHEALKILKSRGILLCVVSKNSRQQVLEKWQVNQVPLAYHAEAKDTQHYLVPDDFVQLKISWEPKSTMLTQLLAELGVTPRQVCFIDDHPVERAEVAAAHPEIFILGQDMNHVRQVLLTHPRFDTPKISQEARVRTATTKARILREEAKATTLDKEAFLASLQVRVHIERLQASSAVSSIHRVVELLTRTNQFNTSMLRLTSSEVHALLSRGDADLFTMAVADRFAVYGLVGAALVVGSEIRVFAMSCRVLGLEAERALLDACLRAAARRGGSVTIPFVNNDDRNLPARRLFQLPRFVSNADGTLWTLDVTAEFPPLPTHLEMIDNKTEVDGLGLPATMAH